MPPRCSTRSCCQEEREPLKSVVALVVDRSQSQEIAGRADETTRAVAGLQERLARFPQIDVRVVEAGRSTPPTSACDAPVRRAGQRFADVPPARVGGAIMITDGQVHDVPVQRRSAFDAPVHGLITGERRERPPYRVRKGAALRHRRQAAGTDLRVIGTQGDDTAQVDVRVSVNGDEIRRWNAPTIGQEMPLRHRRSPRRAQHCGTRDRRRVAGEVTDTNNRAVALIDGIRENLRVLLVSGEPHAGERTWRNLLKSDASVDLVHFTILRPPEKQDGTPINELSLIAFPTRELFVEKIKDFDLIIFDRYQHRGVLPILYYDYIAQYVENGGALLIAAGPEHAGEHSIARTPLSAALPAMPTGEINEKGFYPRLSDTGKSIRSRAGSKAPAASRRIGAAGSALIGVDRPQGQTVMSGADNKPLLVLNRVGEGRVAMLLSDQGWLWARGFEGGGPHVSLYRRIAHWLMKEPALEEER